MRISSLATRLRGKTLGLAGPGESRTGWASSAGCVSARCESCRAAGGQQDASALPQSSLGTGVIAEFARPIR